MSCDIVGQHFVFFGISKFCYMLRFECNSRKQQNDSPLIEISLFFSEGLIQRTADKGQYDVQMEMKIEQIEIA
jgi:hypothetical protein